MTILRTMSSVSLTQLKSTVKKEEKGKREEGGEREKRREEGRERKKRREDDYY